MLACMYFHGPIMSYPPIICKILRHCIIYRRKQFPIEVNIFLLWVVTLRTLAAFTSEGQLGTWGLLSYFKSERAFADFDQEVVHKYYLH